MNKFKVNPRTVCRESYRDFKTARRRLHLLQAPLVQKPPSPRRPITFSPATTFFSRIPHLQRQAYRSVTRRLPHGACRVPVSSPKFRDISLPNLSENSVVPREAPGGCFSRPVVRESRGNSTGVFVCCGVHWVENGRDGAVCTTTRLVVVLGV